MSRDSYTIQRRQGNRPIDGDLRICTDLTVAIPAAIPTQIGDVITVPGGNNMRLVVQVSALSATFDPAYDITTAEPTNILAIHVLGQEDRVGGFARLICTKFLAEGLTVAAIPVQPEGVGCFELPFGNVLPSVFKDPSIVAAQSVAPVTDYSTPHVESDADGPIVLERISVVGQHLPGVGAATGMSATISAGIVVDT